MPWHDRAVFHFLTSAAQRLKYLPIMLQALSGSGAVVIGNFASHGP